MKNGFNPKLVEKAEFIGKFDMPLVRNQEIEEINKFISFDKRNACEDKNKIVHFYIHDNFFKQIINNPEKYMRELKKFKAVISPDFSICYDMPIIRQIYNTYMNRSIGVYYQNNGIKVIPNVRWGDSRSFEFCFEGLEKNGTYAIGAYGQIKSKEKLYYFKKGLNEFFKKLNPQKVYIYGNIPENIIEKYKDKAKIIIIEPQIYKIKNLYK